MEELIEDAFKNRTMPDEVKWFKEGLKKERENLPSGEKVFKTKKLISIDRLFAKPEIKLNESDPGYIKFRTPIPQISEMQKLFNKPIPPELILEDGSFFEWKGKNRK